jgi:preprotein translocase YajC subunit
MSENINSIIPAKSSNTGSLTQIIIICALFVGLILWQNYQEKKRKKEKEQMLNNIKVGDMVQTVSGIIGVISFISDDKQMVEIKTGVNFSSKLSIHPEYITVISENKKPE